MINYSTAAKGSPAASLANLETDPARILGRAMKERAGTQATDEDLFLLLDGELTMAEIREHKDRARDYAVELRREERNR